jgi:hypothetical protein
MVALVVGSANAALVLASGASLRDEITGTLVRQCGRAGVNEPRRRVYD